VQVAPIKPTLKAPGTKLLELQYDELLSSCAFNLNLRRYGKAKKLVKSRPPDKGFVQWKEENFRQKQSGLPETLESSFAVSHQMVLAVLSRYGDGKRGRGLHSSTSQLIRAVSDTNSTLNTS
jgi:hypothetical protein